MNERPTSVTVISWVLIVLGVLSLVSSTLALNNPAAREMMERNPIPTPLQFVILYAGLLISIGSGIAFLKRQNWARFLYIGWNIIVFMIGLATSPVKVAMVPGIVIFAIIVLFLFLPQANAYFRKEPSTGAMNNPQP